MHPFLIWLLGMVVTVLLAWLEGRGRDRNYAAHKGFWFNAMMWWFLGGLLMLLAMCADFMGMGGGSSGLDCTYGRTGEQC